ncbi:MAG: MBL fold metallo-hydrolase [Nitrospirae bacterium]|nr:MBL fold metallo-hydrolase [Nitrospirota bacterium]MCL5285187.1 MBL fold metallo-hydrolase [Nitrospirota bacterium]
MFFRQIRTKESSLSYFFGCATLGKAVAVDVVAGDEEMFLEQARMENVSITHVIDTHIHADHYSGGRNLAERVGARYALHESDASLVRFPFHPLRDNDFIEAGNVGIRVIHTPGHTPDSLCLLVTDRRRGDEPWFAITGDTLFVGAVGRPDLGGHSEEWAGQLFDSLQEKILPLPDHIEIYPAHTSGSVCGKGLSGKPSSTFGFEKRTNPLLSSPDRESFIRAVLSDIPPVPGEMERIVAVNRGECR